MIKSNGLKTLNDYFTRSEEMYGSNPFLKYTENGKDRSVSYSEFMNRARKFAGYVRAYNSSEGRKANVALIGRTGYDYLTVITGTVYAGSVIVPLDSQMNAETLADHLRRSDAEILFYDNDLADTVNEALKSCPDVHEAHSISDTKTLDDLISGHPEDIRIDDILPDECAFIIYTSGTTGKSKGVMLSHKNMLSTILPVKPNPELENGNVCAFLPPHHVFALNCDFLYAFRFGMALCLCGDISHFIDDIKKYQPVTVHIVPMMVKAIHRALINAQDSHPEMSKCEIKDLVLGEKFSRILSGGGGLPEDLSQDIQEFGLRIASGYGMSECSPSITEAPFEVTAEKKGSVGMPLSSCRLRIAEDGEVLVKGDNVMIGYYNSPEETRDVFTEDRWLKTGDIGHLDEDGYLYLTGRKKNLIILTNGENVSPEEIEKRFVDYKAVSEIIVFGKNDSICAEIYPDPAETKAKGREETENAVRKAVNEVNRDMPSYKRISEIIFRDRPFERTSSKKIIRSGTGASEHSDALKTDSRKPFATDLEKKIGKMIAKASGKKDIGADETFASLGLDSFGCVSVITDIFETLGYSIDLAALMENDTTEKLAGFIESENAVQNDYSIREEYPVSNLMKYFIYVINGNTVGNVPSAFELPPDTDIARLKKAVSDALDTHPALKGTVDMKKAVIRRNDDAENVINIIETTEAEWLTLKDHLVTPFTYKPDEILYHIDIYKTEKAVYLRIDLSHAVSDGVSLGMFIREISRAYAGEKLKREKQTFYEYLIDESERMTNGSYDRDSEALADIYKGIKIGGSLLSLDHGMDLNRIIQNTIKQRLYRIDREEVMRFCTEHRTSENILFLTAFNICLSLFSGNRNVFATSIHSGRTDGKYADSIGMYFRQYACRYDAGKFETTADVLDDAGVQVRNAMKMHSSCSNNGEFLFQFQGDIFHVDKIGDLPCKRVDVNIDCYPFRIMIMNGETSYLMHLSYWANRFDTNSVYVFIDCYQHIVNGLLRCKTIPEVIAEIPKEICPEKIRTTADEINRKTGRKALAGSSDPLSAYVLDSDDLSAKPFGAWGTLYISDERPSVYNSSVKNPYSSGILYNTGIKARIMTDHTLDIVGPESRVVRVETHRGGFYYDLSAIERTAMLCEGITRARAYIDYEKSYRVYVLKLDVETANKTDEQSVRDYFENNVPENLRPVKIRFKKPEIRRNALKRRTHTAGTR